MTKIPRDKNPSVLASLERMAWTCYAAQRFTLNGRREAKARKQFIASVELSYDRFRDQARRHGGGLDYVGIDLRLLALKALSGSCQYCGDLFGLDAFGFVLEQPPRTQSHSFGLANVVCCCELCTVGKGSLSGPEWRDVLMALRAAEGTAARDAREALAAGRTVRRGSRQGEGTPGGVPACG